MLLQVRVDAVPGQDVSPPPHPPVQLRGQTDRLHLPHQQQPEPRLQLPGGPGQPVLQSGVRAGHHHSGVGPGL